MKQLAKDAGIAEFSEYFHELSLKHDRRSKIALVVTVVLGVFLVVWAFVGGVTLETFTGLDTVSLLIPRISFSVVLIAGLIFASRIYSAETHNAILNTHKAKSLQTFGALVAGAMDDEVRDAILAQAATAIFMHQDSGYLKNGIDFHHVTGTLPIKNNLSN